MSYTIALIILWLLLMLSLMIIVVCKYNESRWSLIERYISGKKLTLNSRLLQSAHIATWVLFVVMTMIIVLQEISLRKNIERAKQQPILSIELSNTSEVLTKSIAECSDLLTRINHYKYVPQEMLVVDENLESLLRSENVVSFISDETLEMFVYAKNKLFEIQQRIPLTMLLVGTNHEQIQKYKDITSIICIVTKIELLRIKHNTDGIVIKSGNSLSFDNEMRICLSELNFYLHEYENGILKYRREDLNLIPYNLYSRYGLSSNGSDWLNPSTQDTIKNPIPSDSMLLMLFNGYVDPNGITDQH